MTRRLASRRLRFLALVLPVLWAVPAAAQTTYTWTGGAADANWSSPLNWSAVGPGSVPPNDDLANTFLVLTGADQTSNFLDYSFSANSLTFDAAAEAFVIGNPATTQTLTLGAGGITVASGNAFNQTFNANLALGAAQTWTNDGTGAFSVGGTITNGGFLLTVGGAGNSTFGGQVSGTGGLTKVGSGTLTLSASNTFSGSIQVGGGTLSVAADSALGAVPSSATAGKIVLDAGTLAATATFTLSTNRGIWIGPTSGSGTGTINVAATRTLTYGGVIANNPGGTGGLVKTGAGTLVLSGSNTYSGTTTINGGVLSIQLSTVLPAGPAKVVLDGGTLRHTSAGVGSTFINTSHPIEVGPNGGTIDIPNAAAILIYSPATNTTLITSSGGAGTGTITKSGAGTLRLSTSTTTAALMSVQRLVVTGGLWQGGLDGCFGAVPVSALADQITLNGGGISSNAGFTLNANRGITLGASSGTINTSSSLTYNGRITGVGGLTKTGTSTLLLGGASNDYAGGTTITAGTVQLTTGNNRLPVAGNLAFTGGTLDLNTRSQTVNALSSSGAVGTITSVAAGTSTLTVGNGNGSGTFGGVIQNGGAGGVGVVALTKTGTGTLTLTGTNTYTGATNVNAGALIVSGAVTNSAVTATGTGTIGGTGTAGASLTIAGGGTLSPGSSPGALSTGAATFGAGGNYNWQLLDASGAAGVGYDVLNAATLDVSATSVSPFIVNLWTLSSTAPDANGAALNFDASQEYTWTLVHTTGGITNFAADKFQVNSTAANGAGGFQNSTFGGVFSVGLSAGSTDLLLSFAPMPVPELGTGWAVATVFAGVALVRSVRRRRTTDA